MKKIMTLLAMMAMLFVSCEDLKPKGEGGDDQLTPSLELTSESELEFAAEGGEGTILYVLRNAVEWASVSADCDADWITDLAASDNKTTFKVAEYSGTSEPRSAEVVVSYGNVSIK